MAKGDKEYYELALEVHGKLKAILDECDGAGGLGCLINCAESGDVLRHLQDARAYLREAVASMNYAIVRLPTK